MFIWFITAAVFLLCKTAADNAASADAATDKYETVGPLSISLQENINNVKSHDRAMPTCSQISNSADYFNKIDINGSTEFSSGIKKDVAIIKNIAFKKGNKSDGTSSKPNPHPDEKSMRHSSTLPLPTHNIIVNHNVKKSSTYSHHSNANLGGSHSKSDNNFRKRDCSITDLEANLCKLINRTNNNNEKERKSIVLEHISKVSLAFIYYDEMFIHYIAYDFKYYNTSIGSL